MGMVAVGDDKILVAISSAPTPKGTTSITDTGQNLLYSLTTHQEFETSPDVVISKLKLLSYDVYYLLDPGLPFFM